MKIRFTALVLVFVLLALSFSGCGEIAGEIAGNVKDAAVKELENQLKSALETYSVEVVEIKSAVGKLNNEADSDLQFYCGALVRSKSDVFPQRGAEALAKVFEQAGCTGQNQSRIDTPLLTNKEISFKHTDFSSGDYYLIWIYTASFTEKLSELELPTLPASWKSADETTETAAAVG